jgi:hypothetical protein
VFRWRMLEWALVKLLCVEPTGVAMVVEGRCMPGSSCFNARDIMKLNVIWRRTIMALGMMTRCNVCAKDERTCLVVNKSGV